MILCGSLLIVIGLAASVFAPSVAWLTFTFGIVFGSGLGTVYTINVIFLQQYFVKMRGLALGLNYAGSTTAGFIFPIVITYLLGEYGFQGTVLILSGVLLHIFVLCLTHREAPWLKERTNNGQGAKESRTSSSEAVPTSGRGIDGTSLHGIEEVPESGGTLMVGDVTAEERAEATAEASDETEIPNEVRMYPFEELQTSAEEKHSNQHSNAPTEVADIPKYVTSVSVELPSASAETLQTRQDDTKTEKPSAPRVSLIASLSILKIPEFLVIIFSFALFLYAYDAYFTTIIDFIVDQNIPLLKATTIVPLYSATDMIARLSIPQLGDRGYINKMLLQCLAYALQSACFFMMPIAASTGQFFWIAALAMVQSTGVGTSIVMYGVLMAELIGVSRLPMGYGIVGLFVGLTYFTKPYFVGESVGSRPFIAGSALLVVYDCESCYIYTAFFDDTYNGLLFTTVSSPPPPPSPPPPIRVLTSPDRTSFSQERASCSFLISFSIYLLRSSQ